MPPIYIRIPFALSRSFAQRRRVYRLWVWRDTSPLAIGLSNLVFRLRRPVLAFRVWQRVRLLRRGIGVLDA